jgi:hypothetical protein
MKRLGLPGFYINSFLSILVAFVVKMDAICSSETSESFSTNSRRQILEEKEPKTEKNCCQNPESYTLTILTGMCLVK